MATESVPDMVERYRKLTAAGDPGLDGERLLSRIVRARDPLAVELLLTLYPTDAGWNGDERDEVVSALRNAPKKLFVPVFARLAAKVCRDTPLLFDDLMGYAGVFCLKPFLAALPPLAAEDRERMVQRVTASHAEIWKDDPAIPPEVEERQAALVAGLRGD